MILPVRRVTPVRARPMAVHAATRTRAGSATAPAASRGSYRTASTPASLRARIRRALDRLERTFGRPRPGRRLPPLDELVLTILSQNTSDTNSDRAFAALRRRFPTWERVLRAGPRAIERAIRSGGLSRIKSRVIHEVLLRIKDERGRLSLDHLRGMPLDEARRYLMRFRGVGEKTACCVLLFSLGRPAFPVDTHIHRVTRRLGWVPGKATPAVTHAIMGRLVPADRTYSGHVNLITLGRRICRPGRPNCPACPLQGDCRHAVRAWPRPARLRSAAAR